MTREQCKMTNWEYHEQHQICVSYYLDNHGICYGDSGGPLVMQWDGEYFVIGVTSYFLGDRCGEIHNPSYYSNVGFYVDMITKVIREN